MTLVISHRRVQAAVSSQTFLRCDGRSRSINVYSWQYLAHLSDSANPLGQLMPPAKLCYLDRYRLDRNVDVVPATVAGVVAAATELHERVHFDLVQNWAFGLLQRALRHFADVNEVWLQQFAARRLAETIALSEIVHEATASFLAHRALARADRRASADVEI